jgi:hypothetical protein
VSCSDWRREHEENQKRAAERLRLLLRRQAGREGSWIDRHPVLVVVIAMTAGAGLVAAGALFAIWMGAGSAPDGGPDDGTLILVPLLLVVISLLLANLGRPR